MENTLKFKVFIVVWSVFVQDYKTFYNYNVFSSFSEASQFMKRIARNDFADMIQKGADIQNVRFSDKEVFYETPVEMVEFRIIEEEIKIDKAILCMLTQFCREDDYKLQIVSDAPVMQLCSADTYLDNSFLKKEIPYFCKYEVEPKLMVFPDKPSEFSNEIIEREEVANSKQESNDKDDLPF